MASFAQIVRNIVCGFNTGLDIVSIEAENAADVAALFTNNPATPSNPTSPVNVAALEAIVAKGPVLDAAIASGNELIATTQSLNDQLSADALAAEAVIAQGASLESIIGTANSTIAQANALLAQIASDAESAQSVIAQGTNLASITTSAEAMLASWAPIQTVLPQLNALVTNLPAIEKAVAVIINTPPSTVTP